MARWSELEQEAPELVAAAPKLAGRVEEVIDPELVARMNAEASPGPAHLFRADVTELSVLRMAECGESIVVESWHQGRGLSRVERR
jgi:hypothetical protein